MKTVQEVAEAVDVTPDTVRHYVRMGLLSPVRDPHNGYRLFSLKDVERLRFIHQFRQLGVCLNDIEKIIQACEDKRELSPELRDIIKASLERNRRQLKKLRSLQRQMEVTLKQWNKAKGESPSRELLCRLIDNMSH